MEIKTGFVILQECVTYIYFAYMINKKWKKASVGGENIMVLNKVGHTVTNRNLGPKEMMVSTDKS